MKMAILLVSTMLLGLSISASASDLPAVTHYGLDIRFQLREQRLSAVAYLTIRNGTKRPFTDVPFLLYRLLTVEGVRNHDGRPLDFKQDVIQLSDEPSLQARAVTVVLPSPLLPDDSLSFIMQYGGFMFGYPEVMAYVRDRIDEEYSLLRPDAFAYPVLAEPSFASAIAANDTKFTYEVTATVPRPYRVACGGELTDTHLTVDSATFFFRSKIPTWRIDIAAAKFSLLENPEAKLAVYHLPEDSTGARRVLDAARDVIGLFSGMFGKPKTYRGYSVIEIPDGWGSQASDYYFLQTAAAFKDSTRIPEVYHEIGHSWNATSSGEIQRCRYFDEAFASFFQALAVRAFRGEKAFEDDMEQSRALFVRWAKSDSQVFRTPIAQYGSREMGRHSYTKGAWSLYVLYRIVGEKTFASIIRAMLAEYGGRTIDFDKFRKLCEHTAGKDLQKYFEDWIFGTESSRLMVDNMPMTEILKRY